MEYTETNLKKLKVSELKAELSKHSLAATGKKEELIARLLTFSRENPNPTVETAKPVVPAAVMSKQAILGTAPAAVASSVPQKVTTVPVSAAPVSSNLLSPSSEPKTEEEKLKERAKRFGLPEVVQTVKKPKIAETGTIKSPSAPQKPVINNNVGFVKNESVDTLKKRQERFGIVNPNVEKVIKMTEEDELKRKRMERFGLQENGKKSKI